MTDEEALALMRQYRTIAVVGLSKDPAKPSHIVPKYLQERGYRIIPVNPTIQGEILGERAYASLADVPGPVDMVEIFRPAHEVLPIAREAVRKGVKVVWMQEGIVNNEAARLVEEAGIAVVMDKCMLKIHRMKR